MLARPSLVLPGINGLSFSLSLRALPGVGCVQSSRMVRCPLNGANLN